MSGSEGFRYNLPDKDAPSRWSGLSQPARQALIATAVGPSAAKQLLNGSEAAVSPVASEEIGTWAERDLAEALDGWQPYTDMLTGVPRSVNQLQHPNFGETVTRLFEAREALRQSGETTPEGTNVGDTMKLAVIPWQDILNNLQQFDTWVESLGSAQDVTDAYYIGPRPLEAITGNQPFYRDPNDPTTLITASEYLREKIEKDGPWGIMLAQTSNDAGLASRLGQSPNALTEDGEAHLEVAGYQVDAMGIFEWIALALQRDPSKLSSEDYSWFLANRSLAGGAPQVAYGYWRAGDVGAAFGGAGGDVSGARPRLAVM